MSQAAIKFGPSLESGDEALGGAAPHCVNVVVDGKGAVRRRPGIVASSDYLSTVVDSNGIAGIYKSVSGDTVAVSATGIARRVYRIGLSNAIDVGALYSTGRPTFAETEALLAITAGEAPRKFLFSDKTLSDLGGGPAPASHVIAISSRLLLNRSKDYTSQIQYSDFAAGSSYTGFETWLSGAAGFFSAEARADPIVALFENTNEVFAFGKTNVQVFAPDAVSDYAPVSAREYGCSAPASIIKVDQGFAWLDHQRRIILSDGRAYEELSTPIAAALDDLSEVSDCYGYRVQEGQYDLLVWTFPTSGITYAHQVGAGWTVWSGYSSGSGWTTFPVLCHHLRTDGSSENLVGTTDGKIAKLSRTAYTDLGNPIQCHVESGYYNRGTDARKHCKCLRLVLKRGVSTTSSSLSMQVRYRDDEGSWSDPFDVDMGAAGDTDPVVEIRSIGVYRRRQWQMNFQGDEDFVLVSATEEYDVLEV